MMPAILFSGTNIPYTTNGWIPDNGRIPASQQTPAKYDGRLAALAH